MVYNVPSRTGKPLSFETVEMLADHDNFWAIKEASGSTDDFAKYAAAAPNAHMMSGDDSMTYDFARLGGQGVVSVAGNPWPKAVNEYAKQCVEDTLKEVDDWKRWSESMFCASNPVPAKVLMAQNGDIAEATVRLPLSLKDIDGKTDVVTKANEEVSAWLESQN